MLRKITALSTGILLVVLSRPSSASVVVPASLEELSRSAIAIVHGEVSRVESRWAESGRRRIETLVAIEVRQYLKGNLGGTVVIRVPGGRMGRYQSVMAGAPTFREGDEVILFLGANGPSYPFILGLGQGVYRVARNVASSAALVSPPALTVQAQGAGRVVRGDSSLRPWPLQRFTEEVRRLANEQARGKVNRQPDPRRGTAVIRGGSR